MTENRELELYLHIPFCVRKCLYCDFLSAPASPEVRRRYMDALIRETAQRAENCRGRRVTSVFLGGGTPSVVDTDGLEKLLETIGERYALSPDAERTVEVNPGTVDGAKLARLRKAGVNRLSIGLQSADDRTLAALGRIHTWQQFLDAYYEARQAGFTNINVDVMSALPGQSLSEYLDTLHRVLALKPAPEHISAYSLILEEGTPLWQMAQEGKLKLPNEDTDRLMYRETKRLLQSAGYTRYEISNYAKEGYACRHNCGYWTRRDYLGLGIGAASLLDNVRFRNGSDLERYLENPSGCREEVQVLSPQEQMEEFMFLGLRMTEGVSEAEFVRLFGRGLEEVYGKVIEKNIREGLLQRITGRDGREDGEERLALTELGMDLSNHVMAQFLLS